MRRKSDVWKVWPVLHRLVGAGSVSRTGGFSVLLPSFSLQNWHRVYPAAVMAQRLKLLGYNGWNLRYHHLNGYRQSTTWAERGATERTWKDTLLSSPGALSADNKTERLFISDTHHHRIIIADGDGRVLDCIGSSPGMEDGTFETGQLCYPASTVFDANHNFLYIADSENHAIRRADLGKRTLGTVHSPKVGNIESSLWERFLRWLGTVGPGDFEEKDQVARNFDVLRYPWHLKVKQHGLLLVASRCFENIWGINSNSGKITDFQSLGSEAELDEFLSSSIDFKDMKDLYVLIHDAKKGKESRAEKSWPIFSAIDTISRVVRLHNRLFFVDTEGQIIRRYDLETGNHETFHLSNLGLLGLPWWWSLSCPNLQSTDGVSTGANLAHSKRQEDNNVYHQIHVQPGRCLLCITPVLPRGMVLAAPREEGSTWRQVKGSIVDLSMFGGSLISHKISSAQQWVDDLDDLDDPDLSTKKSTELIFPHQSETGFPLYSLVDTSLGAGEVIIDAVLYLKYPASQDFTEEFLGFIKGTNKHGVPQDWVVHQEDQIFLTRIHVKVRLEIANGSPEARTVDITVQL